MSEPRGTSVTLLDAVQANDVRAWERLVGLYRPLVLFWCRRAGASATDAEDVAQDVFAAVLGAIGRFRRDREGDTFRGWLRGITRNKLLQLGKRRRVEPFAQGGTDAQMQLHQIPGDILDEADPPEEDPSLYRRALELVRDEFEPATWRAFWRVAVDGLTATEAAAELGMSPAAVRQSKSRVLRRLRDELGELLD
ncbi:MAG: sigma-70 family RNA polymerase sigma factor [Isosphaeraceae bacterium]